MKETIISPEIPKGKSRVFFKDGKFADYSPKIAYDLWLNGNTALRTCGDNRPVQPWEFNDTSSFLD